MRKLIVFTLSYPYTSGGEGSFLKSEVEYLVNNFDTVIIVPQYVGGDKYEINAKAKVCEGYSEYLKKTKYGKVIKFFLGISVKFLFLEIKYNPKIIFSLSKFCQLIKYVHDMRLFNKWLKFSQLEDMNTLFYTYWFTSITSSLILFRKTKRKIITRVHGIDLYEERHKNYIPLRLLSINGITQIHCVSNAGKDYLTSKYPQNKEKYKVSKLGIHNSRFNGEFIKKDLNTIKIVSCSSIIKLKRVDLITKGIYNFAKNNTNLYVKHIHFGDGPLRNEIELFHQNNSLRNFKAEFHGNVSNDYILDYYSREYIDLFINASTTEGGSPVSIQEAQSFGIICIGTNVGGVPDIVNDYNGRIVKEDITYIELSMEISSILNIDNNDIVQMRKNSYLNWKSKFNANINFPLFVDEIIKI
jgi:glycosyltransferase involved in cell wall biosynthesis